MEGQHALAYLDNNSTQWQTYHVMENFATLHYKENQTFNFQYRVINGTITSFQLKQPLNSFEANILDQNKTLGMFEIKIPRNYPYTNQNLTTPTNLIILLNGQEIKNFNMETTDCFFYYKIPFSEYNSIIDLIFTYVPEYGTPHGNMVSQHCIEETIFQNPSSNINTSVPEFPFTIPVLLISIVSVIIFYKLKFR
ncbi:MAG: hypothetical protein ABI340_04685 [Nitrososphaera sp.]|jgi:hypothetical protein